MSKDKDESVVSCLFGIHFWVVLGLGLLLSLEVEARFMSTAFESFVFDEDIVDMLMPQAR